MASHDARRASWRSRALVGGRGSDAGMRRQAARRRPSATRCRPDVKQPGAAAASNRNIITTNSVFHKLLFAPPMHRATPSRRRGRRKRNPEHLLEPFSAAATACGAPRSAAGRRSAPVPAAACRPGHRDKLAHLHRRAAHPGQFVGRPHCIGRGEQQIFQSRSRAVRQSPRRLCGNIACDGGGEAAEPRQSGQTRTGHGHGFRLEPATRHKGIPSGSSRSKRSRTSQRSQATGSRRRPAS